jgi:hypothetical protein
MKLVTQDYGCGTSSSILDYGIEDVIIVSEANFNHVFDIKDDLLFIGHDFLFFLWDNEEKINKWIDRKDKWQHWVWCFERIDAIVPQWQQKSHYSLNILNNFCKRVIACDEDDCDKYGLDWLPQWASPRFFYERDKKSKNAGILFSGQAGKPEYHMRNVLLTNISKDADLSEIVKVTNIQRVLSWDEYIENLLSYNEILNPVGILKGMNTRAYEALYSGRFLYQHKVGPYKRHQALFDSDEGIIFFDDIHDLKTSLNSNKKINPEKSFNNNTIFSRMKTLGIKIK